jgi:hypothetical protein
MHEDLPGGRVSRAAAAPPNIRTALDVGGRQDTAGNKALGTQAYTFVWALQNGEWGIVQAHFSSQLAGVEPAEVSER